MHARKLKMHLRSKIGARVDQEHPTLPWMVSWAAEVIVKYEVWMIGRDMKGHKARHKVLVGEYVNFTTNPTHWNKFDRSPQPRWRWTT